MDSVLDRPEPLSAVDPEARAIALAAQYHDADAQTLLRVALSQFKDGIALVSSFGAESAVLLHMVAEIDAATPAEIALSILAGATAALVLYIGAVAGNQINFSFPKLQLINPPTEGDRNGMMTQDLEFMACENTDAGNDEYSIAFVPAA